MSDDDVSTLARAGATACFCPTTERDLADGIGPAVALHDAGARLSLGSDQHAVIDMFEEARGLEMHERLTSNERGRLSPRGLLAAATRHAGIGWPDAGEIVVGARADLVVVNGTASSFTPLMNQGNGTFVSGPNYSTAANPSGLAVVDVNGGTSCSPAE